MHRVRYQDLISMESSGDNALIKTEKTSFIIRTPLVDLERELPEAMFSRIQKSYIVNIGRIEKIIHGSKRVLLDNGDEVPFGKQYYELLLAKVSTKIYKERN
jgi:DNA-binding LytR/AlgR family response regulator